MEAFAGIDLAFAKKKRLPVCLCKRENGCLIPLPLAKLDAPIPPRGRGNAASIKPSVVNEFAEETAKYLHYLESYFDVIISRIAIDAPSAPRLEHLKRRSAETALDRQGISCFTTPSASEFKAKVDRVIAHLENGGSESTLPAANQLWMQVGFALFKQLRTEWECLEVYPQATMHVLGAAKLPKSNKEGLSAQMKAIVQYTGWDVTIAALKRVVCGPTHDGLDAYSSAWIASLDPKERQPLGIPPDDVIWVPNLSKLRTIGTS
jgi:hypothetical protein